jgi:hypothetical protein
VVRFVDLNLSGTSALGNTPPSYLISSRNNQALVINPTSASTPVQLGVLKGNYLFDVTVTDSKGNKTTITIDVQYV